MKNVVAALIITMVLGVSYADTPVNRADVVMGLLERLVCDIEDNFDETNEEQDVDWVSWTQEGFFGEMSTNQTEQILYRKAFDAVLENFATNGCRSLSACDSPIPNCTSEVRAHCISVTNQLMNDAQPLPEVEALRGL